MTATAILQRVEKASDRYAALAQRFGVPADTLRRFAQAEYVAQPRQLQFHAACRECDLPDGPTQVGFGGARGPGKSHGLFAQVALDDCDRFDGLKVLYLRKIAKNAKEQFEDLRRAVLRNVRHDYKAQSGIIHFPNGSRILIGHFKNESDIDSYLGLEYDIVVIEEATTLTLNKYKTLRDSNRTSKEGFRPRIYTSTNPGSVGHAWFKDRFIKPARQGNETDTRFIFATVDDNAFLDDDYTKKLEENTGWKLDAYRYGDWDIAAGQFFTTFRYDEHVIKPDALPNPIPANWLVWAAMDYGFQHPTSCHLFASIDGMTFVVDEYYQAKRTVRSNAEGIKAMLIRHGVTVDRLSCFVAGADVFAKRGDNAGETIADQYLNEDIYLTAATSDRINGAGKLLELLGDSERGIDSHIRFSSSCAHLIEQIPIMTHDPHRPEDVLKVNVDEDGNGGDDAYDDCRYGVMVPTSVGSFETGIPYTV
jgi:phage terminase large subunit